MSGLRSVSFHRRFLRTSGLLLSVVSLAGCERSPSFNVLGSYFPGWIACIIGSVLLTLVLRWLINRVGIEKHLPMLPLFYLSMALLIACSIWLIAFD